MTEQRRMSWRKWTWSQGGGIRETWVLSWRVLQKPARKEGVGLPPRRGLAWGCCKPCPLVLGVRLGRNRLPRRLLGSVFPVVNRRGNAKRQKSLQDERSPLKRAQTFYLPTFSSRSHSAELKGQMRSTHVFRLTMPTSCSDNFPECLILQDLSEIVTFLITCKYPILKFKNNLTYFQHC